MKKILISVSVALLAISCVKQPNPGSQDVVTVLEPMAFNACAEDMTKTSLGSDGASVMWNKGDKVRVFDGSNINSETGNDSGQLFTAQASGSSVVISGSADPASEEYYAIYPSSGSMSQSKEFSANIPSQQIVSAGSFAADCAVMVAKASGEDMNFRNVTALVEFNLQVEKVKSLTLIGNNNEKLTGSIKVNWNNDLPLAKSNVPEMTATLRREDGQELSTGKYYFTILPANFSKGFSVVLGMTDGTQKIVRRSAPVDLKRNDIFATQNVPSSAFKAYKSNFVKFNDGFDITYSHLTLNKDKVGKYAVYINDGKPRISSQGVYFVAPDARTVVMAVLGVTELVVAGDNPDARSLVNPTKSIQAQEKADGYVVLADLNIAPATPISQIVYQQTVANDGFENFGSIIINDCKVNAVTSNLVACSNRKMKLQHIAVEHCDVLLNSAKEPCYMFYTGTNENVIYNLKFHNNVFHNISGNNVLKRFRLVSAEGDVKTVVDNVEKTESHGSELGRITVTNNTFVGAFLNQHGFVRAARFCNETIIQDNIFVESHPAATQLNLIHYTKSCTANMSCNIKNNFFYTEGMTKAIVCPTIPKQEGKDRTAVAPRAIDKYPLSLDWDPARGIFGYAHPLNYGKLSSTGGLESVEGTVAEYRGAQRVTSSDVLNLPDVGYSDKDLGSL